MKREQKFIYTNEKEQSIEFSLWSDFFIDNIDGITGLKNLIYTTKGLNQDGSTYISSTIDNRNIVIQGRIIKDKEKNTKNLLNIINPKLAGKLIYQDLFCKRYVECHVEEAPVITDDRRPSFQISLLCNRPYWMDWEQQKINIVVWKPVFHFPLIVPKNKGIIFGYKQPSLIKSIKNNGPITTGMQIEFWAKGSVKNPSLFNIITREYIKVITDMEAGEKIIVDTNFRK